MFSRLTSTLGRMSAPTLRRSLLVGGGLATFSAASIALTEEEEDSKMQFRRLGSSGLKVSVLSLGTFVLFNKGNEDAAYAVFKAALDAGINFFDTAETYGKTRGDCSVNLGKFLKKAGIDRKDIVISTKIFWGGDTWTACGLSRKHVIEGLEAELKRMELDHVDIVYCHRPDPETPIEETVRAMNYLLDQGKAFYWGTSMWSGKEIAEAHRIANSLGLIPPIVEQPEYHLLCRARVEEEYSPLYDKGMGLTTYSPVAMGLLTGKYNDGNLPPDSRFAKVDFIRKGKYERTDINEILGKVRKMTAIADRLKCTPAQLSVAWILKNEKVSSVILGASKPEQVQENAKALEIVAKLTPEVVAELDTIFK